MSFPPPCGLPRRPPWYPAVTVHGLPHVRLVLEAGPALLLSGPNAAAYAGCGWWRALMAYAPGYADMLDCGDSPGRVLEALGIGCSALILASGPAWNDVAERAARQCAVLLEARPPTLDLAEPGAARHLAAWLGSANSAATSGGKHAGHGEGQSDPR